MVVDDKSSSEDVLKEEFKSDNSEKKDSASSSVKSDWSLLIAIAVIFVVFLLIYSISAYINQPPKTIDEKFIEVLKGKTGEDMLLYNGYAFVKEDGLWNTRWELDGQLYNLQFHYNPLEVKGIPIYGNLSKEFNQRDMYILFDSEFKSPEHMALASYELNLNLIKAIKGKPEAACTSNESEACVDRPIVDCHDSDRPVIYFKEENPPNIELEGICMTISGEGIDMLKSVDKVLYLWFGII